jgi:hypothetical protein
VLALAQALLLMASPGDSMRFEIVAPDSVPAGEPVPILLRLSNPGRETITVYLQGRPIAFDITVSDGEGRVVWRRLAGKVVTAILAVRELEPGATLEFRDVWPQVDGSGEPIASGDYVLSGSLLTDHPEPLRTPPHALRITR